MAETFIITDIMTRHHRDMRQSIMHALIQYSHRVHRLDVRPSRNQRLHHRLVATVAGGVQRCPEGVDLCVNVRESDAVRTDVLLHALCS